jgi:hypothetical protein
MIKLTNVTIQEHLNMKKMAEKVNILLERNMKDPKIDGV